MNGAMKAALINPSSNNLHFSLRVSLFHSTPVLERKRRNFWDSKCNHYSRRFRRTHGKQKVMRSVNDYANFLFQSWKDGIDEDDPSSSRGTSWFKKQYAAGTSGKYRSGNQGSNHWHKSKGNPFFVEDDFDVETIFQSAFGGNKFFYWSFINEENPQWKRSERFSNFGKSWNRRHRSESDYDSSSESDSRDSDLAPDRLALGLSAYGPLKLEDVKNAYRACALKWHPDRHQGSSKAIAEEKFKLCSSAYQSLCDRLALD